MRVFLVFSKTESELSPIIIRPCTNIKHAIARRYDFMMLLNLMKDNHIGIFELFVTLSFCKSTYLRAIREASSSYELLST